MAPKAFCSQKRDNQLLTCALDVNNEAVYQMTTNCWVEIFFTEPIRFVEGNLTKIEKPGSGSRSGYTILNNPFGPVCENDWRLYIIHKMHCRMMAV